MRMPQILGFCVGSVAKNAESCREYCAGVVKAECPEAVDQGRFVYLR